MGINALIPIRITGQCRLSNKWGLIQSRRILIIIITKNSPYINKSPLPINQGSPDIYQSIVLY